MSGRTTHAEEILRAGALNGETPTWSARHRRLFWIDVRRPSFHVFDPVSGDDREWEMPAWIGCYALTKHGAVIALRTGLFAFDIATGALEFLAPPPYDPRRFTFNDGGADPKGRFLAGTMYVPLRPGDQEPGAEHGLPLWRLDRAAWTPLTPDAHTSNGLAWSPDGRCMYHSDTKACTIWVWDYDAENGEPANRHVFARLNALPDGAGPDGGAVDRDGFYWCAVYGDGRLRRYDPDGRLEREVSLPIRYPTMPCFGGENLDTIFVTSANWQLDEREKRARPQEGSLFALPAPVPGLHAPIVTISPANGSGS